MQKTGKRIVWVAVSLLLIAAVVFFTLIFPNTKAQRYKNAQTLLSEGDYTTASGIFAELGTYADAPQLLQECAYKQAEELLNTGKFQDALTAFGALEGYKDSREKILQCYFELGREAFYQGNYQEALSCLQQAETYPDAQKELEKVYFALGKEAFQEEDYKEAVSCFQQAGPDAQPELDSAYYEYGHQEFLKGKYISAKDKFDKIQTLPEHAEPHFQYLEDAAEYLQAQADQLKEEFSCLISQRPLPPPGDTLWDVVANYVPFQYGSAYYDMAEKTLYVTAQYHAGMEILHAWETGDDAELSDDEKQVLQVAQELVEEARQGSDDPMEVERFLYDWLCENVEYESPDMDVDVEAFMQLRQLSCVGALLDGKANCQGYTDAFYLLGNMAGFEVSKIYGTGQWEPHTWNGILLDDKLYLVDVTFGDSDGMGEHAKTYAWLNCAYDPETYTIDGGEHLFPDLVMENDLSRTYYAATDSIFTSVDEAAYYLLRQYSSYGAGYAHAMVEGAEIDNDDLEWALSYYYQSAGVDYYSCAWILNTYDGNTYITIEWM